MNNIFIVNPNSGNGKSIIAAKVISEFCESNNIKYNIFYAENEKVAIELAKFYSNSGNIIYCVGGDGTVNSIINGMAYSNSFLSIIPTGIQNNFCKCMTEYDKNYIDLGKVNDKLFANSALLGLDMDAVNLVYNLKDQNILNNLLSKLGMKSFESTNALINGVNTPFSLLSICNGQYYGDGIKIAPDAKLYDSFFDIYEINETKRFELLKILLNQSKGIHTFKDKLLYYKCDELYIESKVPLICNVDGEIIKDNVFNFYVEPEAIMVQNDDKFKIKELLIDKKIIK